MTLPLEPKNTLINGEEKYVSIFKGDKFVQTALCNLFIIYNSLYVVRYWASLNGHTIIDLTLNRTEQPNYVITDH